MRWLLTMAAAVGLSISLTARAQIAGAVSSGNAEVDQRIHAILDRVSYHSGPNCYNAAAYAKGFVSHLNQMSGMELKYYIHQSCLENVGAAKVGDVVSVVRGGTLEHAMIDMGQDRYFEKTNNAGLYRGEDVSYKITSLKESFYLQACLFDSANCQVRRYTCYDNDKAKRHLQLCRAKAAFEPIQNIQQRLEKISFNKNEDIWMEYQNIRAMYAASAQGIAAVSAEDECALFLLSSWSSIEWHLEYGLRDDYSQLNSVKLVSTKKSEGELRNLLERLRLKLTDLISVDIMREY